MLLCMTTRLLTPIEESVAQLVAAGRSNPEVADELGLSPKAVQWNVSRVYRKLEVNSRAELAERLQSHQPKEVL